MNHAGYSDPTAEQAAANVMKEGKPSRFLPKQLHKIYLPGMRQDATDQRRHSTG